MARVELGIGDDSAGRNDLITFSDLRLDDGAHDHS